MAPVDAFVAAAGEECPYRTGDLVLTDALRTVPAAARPPASDGFRARHFAITTWLELSLTAIGLLARMRTLLRTLRRRKPTRRPAVRRTVW